MSSRRLLFLCRQADNQTANSQKVILEDDVSSGENEKYHVLQPEPANRDLQAKPAHCLWLLSL